MALPSEPLTPLLSAAPGATGVAVAARCGDRTEFLCAGTTARNEDSPDEGHPVDRNTRFELGSLTKTFTALLLAEMAARAEVDYDDPVGKYLPAARTATPPVTLLQLATHTSGLPRLPPGMLPAALRSWYTNPYAEFGPDDLLRALHRSRPRPGRRVHYSNFGVGLLGRVLSEAAGVPFDELLRTRVLRPLALDRTGNSEQPEQATGYRHGRARPPWRIPGLAAAGATRSTAADMLDYLSAHLHPHATPLETALNEVVRPRHVQRGGDRVCLVWSARAPQGRDLLFHSGATRGFTAFAGFGPQQGTALVALANTTVTPTSRFIQRAYEALHTLTVNHHGQRV